MLIYELLHRQMVNMQVEEPYHLSMPTWHKNMCYVDCRECRPSSEKNAFFLALANRL